ncbi:MAG TPA: alpha/beta fold hydrolase, partial [Anaeromyxobacteraceae bacterium]
MPRVTTAPGVELHFSEAGSGRPIVLVHGWAMSSAAFAPVLEPLAASARVITLDLRGHGTSAAGGGQDLATHAHDLARAFDALDLREAVVVGWSMGGQVALEAWPALTRRVAGLVLVGVTPRFTSAPDWVHGLPPASVEALAARLRHRFQPSLRRFFDA